MLGGERALVLMETLTTAASSAKTRRITSSQSSRPRLGGGGGDTASVPHLLRVGADHTDIDIGLWVLISLCGQCGLLGRQCSMRDAATRGWLRGPARPGGTSSRVALYFFFPDAASSTTVDGSGGRCFSISCRACNGYSSSDAALQVPPGYYGASALAQHT